MSREIKKGEEKTELVVNMPSSSCKPLIRVLYAAIWTPH